MTQLAFSDLRGGTTTGISTGHFPEIVMEFRYYLNFAIAKFTEGARRRTRRRTVVLQVSANKADSVKSANPKGGKHGTNAP
jgi:hypothetical protein